MNKLMQLHAPLTRREDEMSMDQVPIETLDEVEERLERTRHAKRLREEDVTVLLKENERLRKALRGAANMLTESAKQHRGSGESGHATMCEAHAEEARKALHQ